MSSDIGYLLRLLVQGDKELKTTKVDVHGAPTKFTSQLSRGHTRKVFAAYNNSDAASGEILWGNDDCDVNGMPIPKGAIVPIPVSDNLSSDGVEGDIDVYFCNTVSGEIGNLRVLEVS